MFGSIVIATALLATGAARAPAAAVAPDALARVVDGVMTPQLQRLAIAGAVVVVVKDGAVALAKGYGFADAAAGRPMTADDTLVHVGSISKLFTGIAVMQLVDRGALDLDRDVNDYLDFHVPTPPGGVPVTLGLLLTHRAGFEEHAKDLFSRGPAAVPLGTWLARALPRRLFPGGDVSAYSNYGMALAGYVVERASGLPFAAYVRERILVPLKMAHTTFEQPLPPSLAPLMAKSYSKKDAAPLPFVEVIHAAPAGALAATGADMGRFMLALFGGGTLDGQQVLAAATLARMMAPVVVTPTGSMGLAFFESRVDEQRLIGHDGGTMTFNSRFLLSPEQRLGLFVSYDGGEIGREWNDLPRAVLRHYAPVAEGAAGAEAAERRRPRRSRRRARRKTSLSPPRPRARIRAPAAPTRRSRASTRSSRSSSSATTAMAPSPAGRCCLSARCAGCGATSGGRRPFMTKRGARWPSRTPPTGSTSARRRSSGSASPRISTPGSCSPWSAPAFCSRSARCWPGRRCRIIRRLRRGQAAREAGEPPALRWARLIARLVHVVQVMTVAAALALLVAGQARHDAPLRRARSLRRRSLCAGLARRGRQRPRRRRRCLVLARPRGQPRRPPASHRRRARRRHPRLVLLHLAHRRHHAGVLGTGGPPAPNNLPTRDVRAVTGRPSVAAAAAAGGRTSALVCPRRRRRRTAPRPRPRFAARRRSHPRDRRGLRLDDVPVSRDGYETDTRRSGVASPPEAERGGHHPGGRQGDVALPGEVRDQIARAGEDSKVLPLPRTSKPSTASMATSRASMVATSLPGRRGPG